MPGEHSGCCKKFGSPGELPKPAGGVKCENWPEPNEKIVDAEQLSRSWGMFSSDVCIRSLITSSYLFWPHLTEKVRPENQITMICCFATESLLGRVFMLLAHRPKWMTYKYSSPK